MNSLEQHATLAEQHVIGGILLSPDALDQVADIVTPDDFAGAHHRSIYAAMMDLAKDSKAIDLFTVEDLLAKRGELEQCGGLAYLGMLHKNTPSVANIHYYAKAVRDASLERQLLKAAGEIERMVRAPGNTADKLDEAQKRILAIAEHSARSTRGFVRLRDLLTNAVDRIDALFNHGCGRITGVATGFADFDTKTTGLQPSDLIIVAGRPSMGKTTFAMNIAEHAAVKAGLPVAVFSMEMPSEQLTMRHLASLGRIDHDRLRSGALEEDDWPRLTSAVGVMTEAPLFIDDTPALTPTELRARARRLVREHKHLGLIVIDYLQLMRVPGKQENRTAEISEISRSLKSLAKELRVPIVALSQLNRSLEQRTNKRPIMSDLRESGAIEQDADLIAFLYRDEVYDEHSNAKGTTEVIIGKQRNGPLGMVRLTANLDICRFDNYAGPPIEDNKDENIVRQKKWSKGFV